MYRYGKSYVTASEAIALNDLDQVERSAQALLPRDVFDYFAGGSGREATLKKNESAWEGIELLPHVLRDVTKVDTTTSVLGATIACPVLVAPTGYQRLLHPDGESGTAESCQRAGTIMVVSSRSSTGFDALHEAAPEGLRWFQVYVFDDHAATDEMVDRAVEAGVTALVLTADAPFLGRKDRDVANGFRLDPALRRGSPILERSEGDPVLTQDPAATFRWIERLRSASGLPVVVKGILRADDARRCVDEGAAAVIVSNHGGRQLDGSIATADALPLVIDEIGDAAEVYVDGGIRSGAHVLRALALGAQATLVGRPAMWGLAVEGADGVHAVLRKLREELEAAMALAGTPTIDAIDRSLVRRSDPR